MIIQALHIRSTILKEKMWLLSEAGAGSASESDAIKDSKGARLQQMGTCFAGTRITHFHSFLKKAVGLTLTCLFGEN
jgi:hypothetical protein